MFSTRTNLSSLQLNECGKVLISSDHRLHALECFYCKAIHTQWESFMDHVKKQHKDQEMQYKDIDVQNNVQIVADDTHEEELFSIKSDCITKKIEETNLEKVRLENIVFTKKCTTCPNGDINGNDNVPVVEEYLNEDPDDSILNDDVKTQSWVEENSADECKDIDIIEVDNIHFIPKEFEGFEKTKMKCPEVFPSVRNNFEENMNPAANYIHSDNLIESNESSNVYFKKESLALTFPCPHCDKVFAKKKYLHVHARRHTQDFAYKCEFCDKRTVTSTDMTTHMRVHTGEKPYVCEACGKSFKTCSVLNAHRRKHELPKYQCTLCPKLYFNNHDLKNHMNAHLNKRDYQCEFCMKAFTSAKILYSHKMNSHSELRKTFCKICKKCFTHIEYHIKSMHKSDDILGID